MTVIKCENCGKMTEKEFIKNIIIGQEIYFVCEECYKICTKFKQDHELK